ncbi:MAG: hypothetical protein KatS3mg111_3931 [Pirellulaceae bacterium]|nr:MAG: hypothetical protein KatS3mg111_3931 [Pirellulaceae bacterium]
MPGELETRGLPVPNVLSTGDHCRTLALLLADNGAELWPVNHQVVDRMGSFGLRYGGETLPMRWRRDHSETAEILQ